MGPFRICVWVQITNCKQGALQIILALATEQFYTIFLDAFIITLLKEQEN